MRDPLIEALVRRSAYQDRWALAAEDLEWLNDCLRELREEHEAARREGERAAALLAAARDCDAPQDPCGGCIVCFKDEIGRLKQEMTRLHRAWDEVNDLRVEAMNRAEAARREGERERGNLVANCETYRREMAEQREEADKWLNTAAAQQRRAEAAERALAQARAALGEADKMAGAFGGVIPVAHVCTERAVCEGCDWLNLKNDTLTAYQSARALLSTPGGGRA